MTRSLMLLPLLLVLLVSCNKDACEQLSSEQLQAVEANGKMYFVNSLGEFLDPEQMPTVDSLLAGRLYEIAFSKQKDKKGGKHGSHDDHDDADKDSTKCSGKSKNASPIKIHKIKLLPNGVHLAKVVKVNVENGCLVLVLESGKKLAPIFKNGEPFTLKDGQTVRFDYQEATNTLTVCMVGTPVYVNSIELVKEN